MTSHLLPCPECSRHVRALDPVCPFCGEPLPMAYRAAPARPTPMARLGRAATFAFGAAVASSVAAGCNDGEAPRTPEDAGQAPMADAASPDGGAVAPLYGAAPPDGGGEATDAGAPDSGASDAGEQDAGTSDAGAPPSADAGSAGGDDGGVMPLYGASPPE